MTSFSHRSRSLFLALILVQATTVLGQSIPSPAPLSYSAESTLLLGLLMGLPEMLSEEERTHWESALGSPVPSAATWTQLANRCQRHRYIFQTILPERDVNSLESVDPSCGGYAESPPRVTGVATPRETPPPASLPPQRLRHPTCLSRGSVTALPVAIFGIAGVALAVSSSVLLTSDLGRPDEFPFYQALLAISALMGAGAAIIDQSVCDHETDPDEIIRVLSSLSTSGPSAREIRRLGMSNSGEVASLFREDLPSIREGFWDIWQRHPDAASRARALVRWMEDDLPSRVDPRTLEVLARWVDQRRRNSDSAGPAVNLDPSGVRLTF